jgi:hypothetical protein
MQVMVDFETGEGLCMKYEHERATRSRLVLESWQKSVGVTSYVRALPLCYQVPAVHSCARTCT